MSAFRAGFGLVVVTAACGGDAAVGPRPVRAPITTPSTPRATTVEVVDLAEHFTAEGVDGAFSMYDADARRHVQYQPDRCSTRYVPASTFKIPNALIALETGAVDGPDFELPWDGEERWADTWNRDHTLRTAFRGSVVWYFQEVARRIGMERMREQVSGLEYGNAELGDEVDRFWLDGPLAISPNEQVTVLRHILEGETHISSRSITVLREIAELESAEGWTMYGKTGWGRPEGAANVLWLVGWVERGSGRVYFATLILSPDPSPETLEARFGVTRRVLRALAVVG